jgi:hypothetical protein
MWRTLIIVAAAGIVIGVVCIAGAVGLAGRDVAAHGGWRNVDWNRFNFDMHGDFDNGLWRGPNITREIPWDGANELVIAHGGEVRFTQGPERKVLVTGPEAGVNRLHMEDGRLRLDGHPLSSGVRLRVEITAPDVDTFKIYGSSKLDIDKYDQGRLEIEINGSGDVSAAGKARDVEVTIRGSGDVDVGDVDSENASVEIMGSGGTTIAPTQSADIEIKGSGDVTLLTNPAQIETDIKGSGDIRHRTRYAPASTAPASTAPAEASSTSP